MKAEGYYPSIIPSTLKLGLTLVIAVIVISSSPIVMLDNPALAKTSPSTPLPTISTTPSAPSTIGQDGKEGDFTTQAALTSPFVLQSHNIQNLQAIYEVGFKTTTAGAIKTVEIAFPASPSTPIGGARLLEVEGLGQGFLSISGNTLTYTINTPVTAPAGTSIRIEVANIFNPLAAAGAPSITVSITTKDTGGAIIDGPTDAPAYNIRKIGTGQIADGAVTTPKIADGSITSTKPAESFMKKVKLFDNAAGNAAGWNPNGVTTQFGIAEPLAGNPDRFGSSAIVNVIGPSFNNILCAAGQVSDETIGVICATAPSEGSTLDYTIMNLPLNVGG